jgi:hypothetical protein
MNSTTVEIDMRKNDVKVPVTKRALLQRVNRKLAAEGRRVKAARGPSAVAEVGAFYLMNGRPGHEYVFERDVDLEAMARKLGVLGAWEELSE